MASSSSVGSRLIILSAPSGAGKTTLCDRLLHDFSNISLSVSATTRPKRPKETDGVHYFFLSEKTFLEKKQRGDFVETAQVHDHWYGTPKDKIESAIKVGNHILFDIDVQGAESLQKAYKERALLIFIHPPSMEALKDRLVKRHQDSAQSIETRLRNAYNELQWSQKFQYQITNDNLETAYQTLKGIVTRECP